MIPTKEQYKKYFSGQLSEHEFQKILYNHNFLLQKKLGNALEKTISNKDKEMISYLIHTIFLLEENIKLCEYIIAFNELLVQEWHNEHENIAMLLEQIHSETSVPYLRRAIEMNLDYLAWDDNFAFQVKCIWALGCIKGENAKKVLIELTQNSNNIISQNAIKQLSEWKE